MKHVSLKNSFFLLRWILKRPAYDSVDCGYLDDVMDKNEIFGSLAKMDEGIYMYDYNFCFG
jgi:hypothetical protein